MINGIILAGGKSSRMGEDKALLKLAGKTLTQHVYESMKPFINECLIISNNPDVQLENCRTIPDIIKDTGAIGGIYTGLKNSNAKYNLVISCDTPFIEPAILSELIDNKEDNEIIITKYLTQIHPLIGLYSKDILNEIELQIAKKNYKLFNLIKQCKTKILSAKPEYSHSFLNMNTPEDYAFAQKMIQP